MAEMQLYLGDLSSISTSVQQTIATLIIDGVFDKFQS